MIKKFLKILGGIVPFLATHILCCGALLYFLWSSGLLLVLAREGRNKIYLIPILGLAVFFFWIHRRHKHDCDRNGRMGWGDRIVNFLFFAGFYLLLVLAFMIYIFIPWWIPDYKGGLILP